MNKVILTGRLTRDPSVRYSQGENPLAVARFTLAVDRKGKRREGEPTADFPDCVAFGKTAEFLEKYCLKGTKLNVCGKLQTGSYTNRDGQTVYTTEVVVDEAEFAESKARDGKPAPTQDTAPGQGNLSGQEKHCEPAPAWGKSLEIPLDETDIFTEEFSSN